MADCNIQRLHAPSLGPELAATLSSLTEPALVQGFAAKWPCRALNACIRRYGDLRIGLSTGAAIAELNPERALDRPRGRRRRVSIRDYAEAMRSDDLADDAYAFYRVKGTPIESDFSPVRALFGRVLATRHPELAQLTSAMPELDDLVSNVSMRLAYGARSSGSSWHAHGPALSAVVAGSKTWYFRPPHQLPDWLEDSLRASPVPSTEAWLAAAAAASPGGSIA